jgi:hypothetical protein
MSSDLLADFNLRLAQGDLYELNRLVSGQPEEPILIEVAKAVTVALLHGEVEARVLCYQPSDFTKASLLLAGRLATDHQGSWNPATRTLELPNGSTVVVKAALKQSRKAT